MKLPSGLRRMLFVSRIPICIVLCFFFLPGPAFGADAFTLDSFNKVSISKYLEYVVDPLNVIDIERISSPESDRLFSPIGKKKGFGYSRSTFWFRFSANNPTQANLFWYLEHVYPVIDEIDFYYPTSHGFKKYQSGDLRNFSQRPVYYRTSVFPVQQPPGLMTFYIRIKSNGSITIPFLAWSKQAFEQHKNSDAAFHWVYYGIMLATVFYNFFIFFSVREISYLYLIVFIIGCSFFTMAHSGLAFQQLWPDYTWWANVCHPFFGFFGIVGGVLFTRSFLATRENNIYFDRILLGFIILGVVLLSTPFFLEYHYATQSLAIYGALGALTMICGGIVLFVRGLRQARFFLVAWSSWILAVFFMFGKSFGFIPSNLLTDSGIQVGTGMLVVIFSFGLADKINTIRNERERALEKVQKSEKRYRLLANYVKDVIWTMDLATMMYTYITPSVESFRGYTRQEAMRLTIDETLTPDSKKMVLEEMSKELQRDSLDDVDLNRSRTVELEYCHKNGSTVWAEVTTTFLRDQNMKPVGVVGVTRDITERKKAEKEKIRLESQLQQSQKMEAIGTLAGGIAHDFNNILSAVMGNVEISLMEVAKNTKLAKRLKRVLEACDRAKDLVLQILTFSRQDEQTQKPVPVNFVVKEVLKLIRASLPSTIEIRQNISRERKVVLSDPTHIHQVIMNLCTNAADAMAQAGGILGISLDNISIDADTAKQYLKLAPGEYIRLTVTDTGHGMESITIERIFDPFYTTKDQGKGTGMGLALVHGIVTKMGGAIYAYSEPEKGTAFHVFFPKAPEDTPDVDTNEEVIQVGTERILYIDDEEIIVEMAEEMLSDLGYTVTSTTNSREGLELFKKTPDFFDLVITDQTMPDLTGINLAKEILTIRPNMPIIVCTGFTEFFDSEMRKSAGIKQFVMKPYSKNDIAKTIRRTLDQS